MVGIKALLLASLGYSDLNVGRWLTLLTIDDVEDNRSDLANPHMLVWLEPLQLYSVMYNYGEMKVPPDLFHLVPDFCQKQDWHTWIGITDENRTQPDEWWPTVCKVPDPRGLYDPNVGGYDTGKPRILLPMALMNKAPPAARLVFRTDTKSYEPGDNAVCREGYHFHTQHYPSVAEGSRPAAVENGFSRPTASYIIPEDLTRMFNHTIDPCIFIRHPCWCDRAPADMHCKSCRMTESFDSQYLCYGEDFKEHADWCDAVTVERYPNSPKPNRPIKQKEYDELIAKRDAGDSDLLEREIVWMSDP